MHLDVKTVFGMFPRLSCSHCVFDTVWDVQAFAWTCLATRDFVVFDIHCDVDVGQFVSALSIRVCALGNVGAT